MVTGFLGWSGRVGGTKTGVFDGAFTLSSEQESPAHGMFCVCGVTGGAKLVVRLPQMSSEQTRIDRWLWAVRLYKTRALASDACGGGHVEINGHPAKPASKVKVGDRIKARTGSRVRELEVVKVIEKRVGAPIAAECLIDHTPAPAAEDRLPAFEQRDARIGRPTKRDRRDIDRLRGRDQNWSID